MNLAIVSPNKDAYSETFIHNHVKRLPANIHFLFDGHLPKKYSTDGGLTVHDLIKPKKWPGITLTDKDNQLLNPSLAEYLTKHNIHVILCEYGPTGVAMLPVSKQTNIPLVVHFHGYDAYRNDVLEFYRPGYAELFKHVAAVIAVSKHMQQQLEDLGCSSSKLHYLPYGIDTDIFYANDNLPKQYTFVACGRFVEKKAPELTIRAFAEVIKKLPHVTMAMIGDGALLDSCKELAESPGIKQAIHFAGALPQAKIAEIYSRSLVFVQHSVTAGNNDSEGTPLAVMESAACGLPAVSTRHGGIVDIVSEGETGFLVNEKDVNAMAEKMGLFAAQPELAHSMGLKASKLVRSHYNLPGYTQKLWQILQQAAVKNH